MERLFKTPMVPVVPILGAAMCVLLLMSIMADIKTRYFFAWYLGIGVIVYFLYSMRNSALEQRPKRAA
jgi:APA family basic amino acid/polyamine antiporter